MIEPSTMTFSVYLREAGKTQNYNFPLRTLHIDMSQDARIKSATLANNKKNGFLACLNLAFQLYNGRTISLKISTSEIIQITGARSEQDAIEFLKHLYEHYSFFKNHEAYVSCCMANLCYKCNKQFDRQDLRNLFLKSSKYILMSEPLQIYSGVIIKSIVDSKDIMKSPVLYINKDSLQTIEFAAYFDILPPARRKKYLSSRYCTFTIFPSSGNIILSSLNYKIALDMKAQFDDFLAGESQRNDKHCSEISKVPEVQEISK